MTNQAAQTMPETGSWIAADDVYRHARTIDVALNGEAGAASRPAICDVVSQIATLARQHGPLAAALSQTAGVPDVLFDGYAVYQGMTDEARARINAGGVSDVLDSVVRLIRAQGAPAASGGESAASLSSNPNPVTPSLSSESAASVSERARHGVVRATVRATDEDDVLHIECRFDDGQKYAAIETSGHRCEELAGFIVSALEQALTQQRWEGAG